MTFCFLGENCAVYDRHSKLSGISRLSVICEGCTNRARSELNALRYDFVDLSQHFVPSDKRSDAHIFRPKPESSPPLDMQALALRDEVVSLLTCCEDAVRTLCGDRLRSSKVRDGYAVDQAVRYLEQRLDVMARVEVVDGLSPPLSGLECLGRLGALHRRARRCVGLLDPVVALPGQCPRCRVPALRRRQDEAGRVWCQQCHVVMSRDDYHAAMRLVFAPVTGTQPPRSS